MRAIKYGTTKDWVRGMTVVLPDGEILKLGANVAKTSMGFNLSQLITGSEGTLGIITELTMKLIKAPKYDVSVLAPFKDLDLALKAVPKIFQANFRPTAVEFFERVMLDIAEIFAGKETFVKQVDGEDVGAYLLFIFDGDSMDEITPHLERITEFLFEQGAMDVTIADTPDKKAQIWDVRGGFLDAIFELHELYDENDVVVPINRIAEFVQFFSEKAKKYDFDLCFLGHAGDGNLHIFGTSGPKYEGKSKTKGKMDEVEFKKQIREWMWEMYNKSKEMGGELTGEHGIGFGKVDYFKDYVGPRNIELHKGIKRVFDPKLILNPGKVCFSPQEMAQA